MKIFSKFTVGILLVAGVFFSNKIVNQVNDQGYTPILRVDAAPEDFVLEYEITAANQDVILSFFGATNVTVDWGNGSANSSRTTQGELGRTFTTAGTFQVKISGSITGFGIQGSQFFYLTSSNARMKSVVQWGTTGVTSLSGAFAGANNLVSIPATLPTTVTDLSYLFRGKTLWPDPLTNIASWDVSRVTSFIATFQSATNFNTDISAWNTVGATNMSFMFNSASNFDRSLNTWNTSNVTNMASMFSRAAKFNKPLDNWNVSKVTNFSSMFEVAGEFNQNINAWDTGVGVNFNKMFWATNKYNSPLNDWDMSSATNISEMFSNSALFNQPLDAWDVSNVTNFSNTFFAAVNFNQNIDIWDVSSGTDFSGMFYVASKFNQPLNSWDVSNATTLYQMFRNASVFNQPLNNWDVSNVANFGAMFSNSAFDQDISVWNVSNGTIFAEMFASTPFNQDISVWDVSKGTNFSGMFQYTSKFNQPLNTWNIGAAQYLSNMFRGASVFNQPLSNWNTANVVNMERMFEGASVFNQDISSWNTSKVTNMYYMFANAKKFNQNISTWDVSKVTQFGGMFTGTDDFNQPIGVWNTSSATYMAEMFMNTKAFDSYIGEWDVSKVTFFAGMFQNSIFNQDIGGWDTSAGQYFYAMFRNNAVFNQDISEWNMGNAIYLYEMFMDAKVFNSPLNAWNTAKVTQTHRMFSGASVFNQPIGGWNMAKNETTFEMFKNAVAFNQDLPWTTSALVNASEMFAGATAFNGEVASFDMSKVLFPQNFFQNASSFNQPIPDWNFAVVHSSIGLERFFQGATAFDQDISGWNFANVKNLRWFMDGVNLNPLNYDALLQRLIDQNVTLDLYFGERQAHFGTSKYSKVAKALKDQLIASKTWTIIDGGELKLTITVNDEEIYFGDADPTFSVSYTGLVTGAGEDTLTNNYVFTRTPGTEVGDYTVSVSGGDETYYYVTYATGTLSIVKPTIDVSNVTWNYSSAFTYSGNAFTVILNDVPALVTVTYSGNTATNAGTYTASVTLAYDTANYDLEGTIEPLTWTINQQVIDMSNTTWNYTTAYTYSGSAQTVTLSNVNPLLTPVYVGNTATNAGTYTASVSFTFDDANYDLSDDIDALSWTINKATYDMSGVTWSYSGTAFTYDMDDKTVTVSGLPNGVTVAAYSGNIESEPGTYTASVTFNFDANNYFAPSIPNLSWEIFAPTFTITFDTRGGSNISPITGIFGSDVSAPTNPTRSGYVFNGWTISIPETMPNGNLTITASWRVVQTNDNTSSNLNDVVDLSEYEGQDITVALIVELLDNPELSDEDRAILDAYLSENVGGTVESVLFDIRMMIETEDESFAVTELEEGFEVVLAVPEEFQGKELKVIQFINGVATTIEGTYDEATQTIRFNVSQLGTYVLAYESFNIMTVLTIGGGVIGAGLLGWFLFFLLGKRRKDKKEVIATVEDAEEESMENVTFFNKPITIKQAFYDTLTEAEKTEFRSLFVEDTPQHLVKELSYKLGEMNEAFFIEVYKFLYRYRKLISLDLLKKLTAYGLDLATNQPLSQTLIYEASTKTAYARRKDQAFMDYAVYLTRKDIALQRDVLNPRNKFVYSFYRLSIILEKQKLIKEALVIVNEALARELIDKTKGGFEGRKTRLLAKQA